MAQRSHHHRVRRITLPKGSHWSISVSFGYALGDANAATFSVASRTLVTGAAAASGRASLFLNPSIRSAPGLAVRGWQNTPTPTPSLNGRPLPLEAFESSLSLAVAPDQKSFLLGTGWCVRRFGKDGKEIWGRSVASAIHRRAVLSGCCFCQSDLAHSKLLISLSLSFVWSLFWPSRFSAFSFIKEPPIMFVHSDSSLQLLASPPPRPIQDRVLAKSRRQAGWIPRPSQE
jgi:hypothetical protein